MNEPQTRLRDHASPGSDEHGQHAGKLVGQRGDPHHESVHLRRGLRDLVDPTPGERPSSELGELCYATPAVAGNTLYVRTLEHLYAFGP